MESKAKNQRICVACGEKATKKGLYRIVRKSDGEVVFDGTGRVSGRGAYVCSLECFEKASRTKRLEKTLKMSIGQKDFERIEHDIKRAICASYER